ncbi:MAG TPA: hypothetical protein VLD85_11315 [Anaeromyxobacteraceae bacterium]|nr:hypothetical protein [Anaeromyxobacteraceae bacterium]
MRRPFPEGATAATAPVAGRRQAPSLYRAVLGFAAASLVVLAAAPAFAGSAKGIAESTGLGNTFVGTWLVGLVPLDLVQPGNLFAALDPSHALSGLFAVVLMSLGLAAIVYRAKRRFAMLEPDSLLIFVAYWVALWLLYRHSALPGRGAP